MSQRSGSPPRTGLYSPRVSSSGAATSGAYQSPGILKSLNRSTLGLSVPTSPLSNSVGIATMRRTGVGAASFGSTSTLGGLGSPTASAAAAGVGAGLTVRTPAVRTAISAVQSDIASLSSELARMGAKGPASTSLAKASMPGAGPVSSSSSSSSGSATGRYAAPHLLQRESSLGANPSASAPSYASAGPEVASIRSSMQKAA